MSSINEEVFQNTVNNIIEKYNNKTLEIPYSDVLFENNKTHRTFLSYIWDIEKPLCVIFMLNPSSATCNIDDSTTKILKRRLINNNYGGVFILNLYTYICSDSKNKIYKNNLLNNYDIVLQNILDLFQSNNLDIIYAWGNKGNEKQIFKNKILKPLCFGKLKSGKPKHPNPRPPQYYNEDTKLITYR